MDYVLSGSCCRNLVSLFLRILNSRDYGRRRRTVEGKALAIVDTLVVINEVLEVLIWVFNTPNLVNLVDEVSDRTNVLA